MAKNYNNIKESGLVNCILTITVLLILVFGQPLYAETRALLIGVSSYPSLESHRQLRGPANDVLLMRSVLRKKGIVEKNIKILADGVDGSDLPTRISILYELDNLANHSNSGDFVYIHFSGHGSQQPVRTDRSEKDALDEIFLPYDIGYWNGEKGKVTNAITDNEIWQYVNRIRQKGAVVWAVFDSCHAGTMIRDRQTSDMVFRRVEPVELGVPQHMNIHVDQPITSTENGLTDTDFIVFYAAHDDQLAPEMNLPKGEKNRKPHGLFSYTMAAILTRRDGITYRQLAENILKFYRLQNIRQTIPEFAGTELDIPVLVGAYRE